MNTIGKILCSISGGWLAGPIGLLIGLIIGHWLDVYYFAAVNARVAAARQQAAWLQALFMLLGYTAKIDGYVSRAEISKAQQIMVQLRLANAARQQAMRHFYEGKRAGAQALTMLQQLNAGGIPLTWRRLLLEAQIRIALADGCLHPRERQLLEVIAKALNLSLDAYQAYFQQRPHSNTRSDDDSKAKTDSPRPLDALLQAYQLLGIPQHATAGEIKKAYRRAMLRHHPDKLTAQGAPEKIILQATRKTQEIRTAYESIRKAREI